MNQIPMNDGIITYIEFTEKIFNQKEGSPSQSEYENFISVYNQFKENGKINKSLQNINAQNKQILGFNYEKIEHVWAYIHLMIEHIEKNEINILQEDSSLQNLKYLVNLINIYQFLLLSNLSLLVLLYAKFLLYLLSFYHLLN